MKPKTETAMFAAGCFWHVEAAFREIKGVTKTDVGYCGGTMKDPSYEDVCSDKTGHAETVRIEFNPKKVSYEQLLKVFWNNHDPTQLNRQGPDIGSQYRSVIFYQNAKQKAAALLSLKAQKKKYMKPVVTKILPAQAFYKAEEYHQQYLEKRGLATCRM